MPKIFPFRAFRFAAPGREAGRSVCPPYDIISETLARRLRQNPANAIHVELPEGEGEERYSRAKAVWDEWESSGVVALDSRPALYAAEQIFKIRGKRLSRKGFFCAVELEEPGKGSILRHELTLSKPKEDRLSLLRALRVNTSPVFALFKDAGATVSGLLDSIARGEPLVQFRDYEGTEQKLWRLTDEKTVKKVQAALAKTPLLIADGHHRNETAWNYFQETQRSAAGAGAGRALFFASPLEQTGHVVFPTHRVLKERSTLAGIVERLRSKEALFSLAGTKKLAPSDGFSFLATDGKKGVGVRLKSHLALSKLAPELSPHSLRLPLLHLHRFLFPERAKEEFLYTHDGLEALALARKLKSVAFLVPATSVQELESVVTAGELMPQKSTYFHPKIITGLLFRSLDKS